MLSTPTRVDGRVHAGSMPDPEVPERPRRRRFTAEYKLSILREVDAATEDGLRIPRNPDSQSKGFRTPSSEAAARPT